jgi:hypothetical protein
MNPLPRADQMTWLFRLTATLVHWKATLMTIAPRLALAASAGLLLSLAATYPSSADDHGSVVGTWEVVSFEAVSPTTGEREPARGEHPSGYTIFTGDGRMSVLITNEGRKPPSTDQDRANLFQTMVAYTGTYRIEGNKWFTKVDVAANPALIGTEQERSFQLKGDQLQEVTGSMPWAIHPEKGLVQFVITYRRAK